MNVWKRIGQVYPLRFWKMMAYADGILAVPVLILVIIGFQPKTGGLILSLLGLSGMTCIFIIGKLENEKPESPL